MPASFSVEGQISTTLRELGCSARNFVAICREKGISVSVATFSNAMTDIRPLDRRTGSRMLEVASLMRSTQRYFMDVPLAWDQTEKIALLLTLMLLRLVAAEERDDALLDAADGALAHEFSSNTQHR